MRISTSNSYNNSLDSLMQRQAALSGTQEQMTTGKRVNHASDDPAAAARAERALAAERRSVASQRAVDASNNAMTLTESALADAGSLLQQVREALVAAGNATYSDAERTGVANQIADLRQQLFAVANRTDGAGTYLFGGQGATQKPFIDTPTGVQYVAATGQTVSENGTGLPLTTDGELAWLQARTGNGVFVTSAAPTVLNATIDSGSVTDPSALTGADYTLQFNVAAGVTTYAVLKNGLPTAVTAAPYVSGQAIAVDGMTVAVSGTPASGDQFQLAASTPTLGVFAVLDQAVAALKTPGRTSAQIGQGNADGLRDIDAVLGHLQSARSAAGQVLNRIDSESDRLDSQKLASDGERSNAEDVDMVHAISDFQNKQSGYDAALKSYAMVQRLSLFQYVNGG